MKRPKTASISNHFKNQSQDKNRININNKNNNENIKMEVEEKDLEEDIDDSYRFNSNKNNKGSDLSEFVYSLFSKKIYAEIYYAWCKDCNDQPSAESAKYFRYELLSRNNKDIRNYNFRSIRAGKNFLSAFCGNLPGVQLRKVELQDNLVTDECMHSIKNIISAKQVIYLNLASNQISTEGLKIKNKRILISLNLYYFYLN